MIKDIKIKDKDITLPNIVVLTGGVGKYVVLDRCLNLYNCVLTKAPFIAQRFLNQTFDTYVVRNFECDCRPSEQVYNVKKLVQFVKDTNKQVILTTNSSVVLRSLYLESHEQKIEIKNIDFTDEVTNIYDLVKDGISSNTIIQCEIELYERYLKL